jgi:hypothetical protein
MDIYNDTPFADGLTIGLGPERHPCLGVVVKGTFAMPEHPSETAPPAPEQLPVATEDEYYRGDITGSIRMEADTAPFKPRADVVVVGHARAPSGDPVRQLDVSVQVGRRLRAALRVFGDREWVFPTRMAVVPRITDPVPFVEMPLVYERAFGGMDYKAQRWCSFNYIGRGFIGRKTKESVDHTPLPNLENPRDLIASWDDRPRPVGFGFYRRDWQPRAGYAGSEAGHAEADPEFGLPPDFQFDFYNGAHPDLQVPEYLQGNERVELRHLTADGYRQFALPGVRPAVTVDRYDGPRAGQAGADDIPATRAPRTEPLEMHLDTLVLLPDEEQFVLVWRGRTSLQNPELLPEEVAAIHIALQ